MQSSQDKETRTFIDYVDLEEGDFPIREFYSYLNTNIPGTNEPSRCLCDYRESILSFREDSTFIYSEQHGKKDTLYYLRIEGNWSIDHRFNETRISLKGKTFYEKNGLGQISTQEKSSPDVHIKGKNLVLDYDKELKWSGKIIGIIRKQ